MPLDGQWSSADFRERPGALGAGLSEADVLGYSMGGRVALALAVQKPSWLRRLVLVGARPGFAALRERRERIAADEALAARIETEGVEAFADYWEKTPVIASQVNVLPELRETMQRRRREHSAAGLAKSLREMGSGAMPSLWDALREIEVPTHLLTGENDLRFSAIAREMLVHLPEAQHHTIARRRKHLFRPQEVVHSAQLPFDPFALRSEREATLPPPAAWRPGGVAGSRSPCDAHSRC